MIKQYKEIKIGMNFTIYSHITNELQFLLAINKFAHLFLIPCLNADASLACGHDNVEEEQ
ncbi:MAG: hypothetical protein CMM58_08295 [Rhodospirillaceae bacterium]|nr:hypothetical protein [Rhodospirillaceae bacterium]|tara:strand:- start:1634 stop:1813 length:180 start_codon:yes stop_codon:yes gene_type:complete